MHRADDEFGDPEFELEFDEELEEEWLDEWEQADRHAVEVLRRALADHREDPPGPDLAAAARGVRMEIGRRHGALGWVARGAGLNPSDLPSDDAELLISCAAATIEPDEATGLDAEEEALLVSLEPADWLGAIVSAVREGAGADAGPEALVSGIERCPEVHVNAALDDGEASHIATAFSMISTPWVALGITDPGDRLTELGVWLLPRALARAWNGDFEAPLEG